MSDTVELVRLYDGAVTVGVLRAGAGVDPRAAWERAESVGAQRLAMIVPARRDDCDLRVRSFTATRELPRCVESAMAVAAVEGRALTLEQGVTATRVAPADGEGWRVDTPPVVVGTQDLDDPGLAARALGLRADELSGRFPVRAVSCGPNVLVVPLRSERGYDHLRWDEEAWRALIGKARHEGVVAYSQTCLPGTVTARYFSVEQGRATLAVGGLAAAAVAEYVRQRWSGLGLTEVALTFHRAELRASTLSLRYTDGLWWVSSGAVAAGD